jgi:hypothetical protein
VKSRELIFAWLVANLIGKEELEHLEAGEKSEICKKLGIQLELIQEQSYPPAGLQTTWEDLFDAMSKYLKRCNGLAGVKE